jgi:hypothetical protein
MADRTFCGLCLNVDPVPAKAAIDYLLNRCGVRADYLDPADVYGKPAAVVAVVDSFLAMGRTKSLAAARHRLLWNLGFLHQPNSPNISSMASIRWDDVLNNGQPPVEPAPMVPESPESTIMDLALPGALPCHYGPTHHHHRIPKTPRTGSPHG